MTIKKSSLYLLGLCAVPMTMRQSQTASTSHIYSIDDLLTFVCLTRDATLFMLGTMNSHDLTVGELGGNSSERDSGDQKAAC